MLKISSRVHYHKQPARELIEKSRELDFNFPLQLNIDDQSIELCTEQGRRKTCYRHSFTDPSLLRRARQKNQALLRACNNRKREIHEVVDLTAGWGRDSFILASHGQRVTMIEQQPLLAAGLEYLLQIGRHNQPSDVFERLRVVSGNSLAFLQSLTQPPGCLYLDPMFPSHKSTALPAKELQLLQLVTSNEDIEQIFHQARQCAAQRVVVKRPLHAPRLADALPDFTYREKTIRFDVYLS